MASGTTPSKSPKKPSGTTHQGGYDCEFVEQPPDGIETDCPICLLVLRDPYNVTCCRKTFCGSCLRRLEKKTCPMCKRENIQASKNNTLKRAIFQMKVYCKNKAQGCTWTGELRTLQEHLNWKPKEENQLVGCPLTPISCIYCQGVLQRSQIEVHQKEACPKRPFLCEYCRRYEAQYENVVDKHWPNCDLFPVACPNKCGRSIPRRTLVHHVNKKCLLTVVECDFKKVGCEVRVARKDMKAHVESCVATHKCLEMDVKLDEMQKNTNAVIARLEGRLTRTLTKMEEKTTKKISELEQRVNRIDRALKDHIGDSRSYAWRIDPNGIIRPIRIFPESAIRPRRYYDRNQGNDYDSNNEQGGNEDDKHSSDNRGSDNDNICKIMVLSLGVWIIVLIFIFYNH